MAEEGSGEFGGVNMIKINTSINFQKINFKIVKYSDGIIVYMCNSNNTNPICLYFIETKNILSLVNVH